MMVGSSLFSAFACQGTICLLLSSCFTCTEPEAATLSVDCVDSVGQTEGGY